MSLKKRAEITKTSPSTVSRVLNKTEYSKSQNPLHVKIWETARALGYIPNQTARALKTGTKEQTRAYSICILLARFDTLQTDPFFNELYKNIEAQLFKQNGYINTILNVQELQAPSCAEVLRQCDGIIILGRCSQDLLQIILKNQKNIIGIGRNPSDYSIDEIVCNGQEAAALAMDYLFQKGHKRIAYIGDCSNESRYIGYTEALISQKIPLDFSIIKATGQTLDEGYHATKELINSNLPSAILCANDATAIGAIKACKNARLKNNFPDIIGIDDIEEAQLCTPMLTTVHFPKQDMGNMAVKILFDRIHGGHTENIRIEFKSKIVIRESC